MRVATTIDARFYASSGCALLVADVLIKLQRYRRTVPFPFSLDGERNGPLQTTTSGCVNHEMHDRTGSSNSCSSTDRCSRLARRTVEPSGGDVHRGFAPGELLRATNRLVDAEPLFRRALAIDEASYGPDHPEVAIRLNNLARLLQATNRLADADTAGSGGDVNSRRPPGTSLWPILCMSRRCSSG